MKSKRITKGNIADCALCFLTLLRSGDTESAERALYYLKLACGLYRKQQERGR